MQLFTLHCIYKFMFDMKKGNKSRFFLRFRRQQMRPAAQTVCTTWRMREREWKS